MAVKVSCMTSSGHRHKYPYFDGPRLFHDFIIQPATRGHVTYNYQRRSMLGKHSTFDARVNDIFLKNGILLRLILSTDRKIQRVEVYGIFRS